MTDSASGPLTLSRFKLQFSKPKVTEKNDDLIGFISSSGALIEVAIGGPDGGRRVYPAGADPGWVGVSWGSDPPPHLPLFGDPQTS